MMMRYAGGFGGLGFFSRMAPCEVHIFSRGGTTALDLRWITYYFCCAMLLATGFVNGSIEVGIESHCPAFLVVSGDIAVQCSAIV